MSPQTSLDCYLQSWTAGTSWGMTNSYDNLTTCKCLVTIFLLSNYAEVDWCPITELIITWVEFKCEEMSLSINMDNHVTRKQRIAMMFKTWNV